MKLLVRFCLAAAILVVALDLHARDPMNATRQAIAKAMDDSAAAWTAGDLDGFMRLYEDAPTTRYINAHGMVTGYAAIRAAYAPRFSAATGKPMGKLRLELIDVQQLGPQHAFVIGRYHLAQPDGSEATGITTLLFHAHDGQWHIVVDHTS